LLFSYFQTYIMLSAFILSALAGSALAEHRSLIGRDGTCKVQPAGSGPVASPDTVDGFFGIPELQTLSSSATTPDGYTSAFTGLNASLNAVNYMGLWTLTSYDTLGCASLCDRNTGCQAFNMYAERDPSLDPNASNCANPTSITNYKCALWGSGVSASQAVNYGQWRDSFHVVITGSNAYNKIPGPGPIPNFDGPTQLGGAINAPLDAQRHDTYMGMRWYTFAKDQSYDPSVCAAACNSQTAYNKQHPAADGSFMTCRFFNSWVQSKNGVAYELHCGLYNQTWSPQYATNYGQYQGNDRITVSRSYSYTLSEVVA
jgi:hypothetical protein